MSQHLRSALLAICLALMTSLIIPSPAVSEEMPVPANMQVSLFKKIFSYNKKLASAANLKIVVSFTDDVSQQKDAVVKAFQDAGIAVLAVKPDAIPASLDGVSAVYVLSGTDSAKAACQKQSILSITGIPSLVKSGSAAVGLDVSDNKPKIFVHMNELKAEGHEFSAKLLQLAEVIQ